MWSFLFYNNLEMNSFRHKTLDLRTFSVREFSFSHSSYQKANSTYDIIKKRLMKIYSFKFICVQVLKTWNYFPFVLLLPCAILVVLDFNFLKLKWNIKIILEPIPPTALNKTKLSFLAFLIAWYQNITSTHTKFFFIEVRSSHNTHNTYFT